MKEDSYDSICSKINEEWEKIKKPNQDDLREISKKFKVDGFDGSGTLHSQYETVASLQNAVMEYIM